jgi:uncharacterized damage-inducible protein DinB
MSLKEQMLSALEQAGREVRAFIASLPEAERSAPGTYEKWAAKDSLSHVAYWLEERAIRLKALAEGKEPPPSQGAFEGPNLACFERFCKCPWDEINAYVELSLKALLDAVRALDEKVLAAPAPGFGANPLWRSTVVTGYTHPLMHIAEYYVAHGQADKAGALWAVWRPMVAPLDSKPDWQGGVRYNAACGLALAGHPQQALDELREALRLQPALTSWSRKDSDLASLHGLPGFRELYAPPYWWKAMGASPQAEAIGDQFVRTLLMLREAVQAFPAEEWRKGDTPYQRPAGLALHILVSAHDYCTSTPQEVERANRFPDWEENDSARLPSQEELLAYLDEVSQSAARFVGTADFAAEETRFRWVGSTLLSRMVYVLRHTQHHLAEMCLELHRRGIRAPQWQ